MIGLRQFSQVIGTGCITCEGLRLESVQIAQTVMASLIGLKLALASPLLFQQCFVLSCKLSVDRRAPLGADLSFQLMRATKCISEAAARFPANKPVQCMIGRLLDYVTEEESQLTLLAGPYRGPRAPEENTRAVPGGAYHDC